MRQEHVADEALAILRGAPLGPIEMGFPADDEEARALGWPCVGAWGAMAARVIAATGSPIRLVPR